MSCGHSSGPPSCAMHARMVLMEARLADVEGQLDEVHGHVEDVLAICGSRSYVFYLDAAPTERLLSEGDVSMLAYLDEEEDLAAAGGGKLRRSILTGARSEPCMAGVRAMALICEAVFWPMITAIKPQADVHTLDVLPVVWPAAHAFFEAAAAAPERIVDGSLALAIPGAPARPVPASASQARRSERRRLDMARIRAMSAGDATVKRLLEAAFGAMAKGVANHAAEWLPAGLVATDGSTTTEGKLSAARITPELRAKYDALPTTSTPVERLHAIGRCVEPSTTGTSVSASSRAPATSSRRPTARAAGWRARSTSTASRASRRCCLRRGRRRRASAA